MLVPSALRCSVPRRTNGFLRFESVSRTFLLSDNGNDNHSHYLGICLLIRCILIYAAAIVCNVAYDVVQVDVNDNHSHLDGCMGGNSNPSPYVYPFGYFCQNEANP